MDRRKCLYEYPKRSPLKRYWLTWCGLSEHGLALIEDPVTGQVEEVDAVYIRFVEWEEL